MLSVLMIENRTNRKITLPRTPETESTHAADDIAAAHGFFKIDAMDFKNKFEIHWQGIEFNRLFVRNESGKGIVCKFNEWTGDYPFTGIELEEIGYLQTESNERTE